MRLLDAGTGVGKQNGDIRAVTHGLDGQSSTTIVRFHRVDSVVHNIEKDLHQLISVAAHSGKDRLQLKIDFCAGIAQIESAQLNGVRNDGVEIEERPFGRDLASETQQVANKCFGAAGLVANFGRDGPGLFSQRSIVSEEIGIAQNRGQGIIDFMGGTGSELPQRHELFGLDQLSLKALKIFDGLFSAREKPRTIPVRHVLTQKYQETKRNCGEQNGHQPEFTDSGRIVGEFDRVYRKNRQRNDGRHGQTGRDDAFALFLIAIFGRRGIRDIIESVSVLIGDQAGGAEPHEGRNKRQIVKTAGVINPEADGDINHQRRKHVHRYGAKKMGVDSTPGTAALEPKHAETDDGDHVLNIRDQVVSEVILTKRGLGIHPRKHNEGIKKDPPGEKQHKIEIAEAEREFAALQVRTKSERGHKRNATQEKNDVARIQVREGLVEIDLVVGPLKLADHPKRARHRGKHPENIAAPVRGAGVEQEPGICDERHETLRDVAEGVERLARRNRQGDHSVGTNEQAEQGCNPSIGAGRGHGSYP